MVQFTYFYADYMEPSTHQHDATHSPIQVILTCQDYSTSGIAAILLNYVTFNSTIFSSHAQLNINFVGSHEPPYGLPGIVKAALSATVTAIA